MMSKFKIGDRVHYDDRLTKGVGTIHLRAPENEGFDWGVAVAEHDRKRGYHKGNIRWFLARDLRPALTPGRHYRTRSGKVTGRVFKGDTGFEAVVDGKVRIYDAAGGAVHGGDDIVEEWVPKVGERVVVVKTDNFHPAVSSETECVVDGVTGNAIRLDASTESAGVLHQLAYLSDLEPLPVAPQPAAELKIEAGRYYKTRDGRKVGPMDGPDMDGDYYFEGYYRDTGHRMGEERNQGYAKHIIAEWVDEPVAVAAQAVAEASNDNKPVAEQPAGLIKTRNGYGFEIARFGDYVWVDTGKKDPETFRASSVSAA